VPFGHTGGKVGQQLEQVMFPAYRLEFTNCCLSHTLRNDNAVYIAKRFYLTHQSLTHPHDQAKRNISCAKTNWLRLG